MRRRKTEEPLPAQSVTLPMLLTIPDVAKMLKIGRTKVYSLIKMDGLPTVKLGDAQRVSVASLHEWLKQHEQVS